MKKRILALAMSAFMLVGLNTAVFAEQTYQDMSTVDITKNYELAGEGVSPAETFELTCTDAQVTDGDGTAATTDIAISKVTYAAGAAGSEAKTGKFTITLPKYSKTGKYEYTLKETAGTIAGVTYRTEEMKLVVTVIEQSGLVRVAAVHTEKTDGNKSSSFNENTYTANKLNVKKTVTGNLGDKSKEFNFTVTFNAPAGKTWNNDDDSTSGITVTGGATGLVKNGNVYTFTLSDGDTATFANVPAGVTYTVVEDDYSKDGYTTTKTGDTGTMDDKEATAAFTNDKVGDVDTGINLDSLPYILILVVIAGAAVAFFVSKRRTVE